MTVAIYPVDIDGLTREMMDFSDGSGSLEMRRTREPQERQRVPIAPTETIRTRLGMNKENFSEALGLHPSTYAGYLTKGRITKTCSLAAEALMHQAEAEAPGDSNHAVFVLRIIDGVPNITPVTDYQKLRVEGGTTVYLVPVTDTRI